VSEYERPDRRLRAPDGDRAYLDSSAQIPRSRGIGGSIFDSDLARSCLIWQVTCGCRLFRSKAVCGGFPGRAPSDSP